MPRRQIFMSDNKTRCRGVSLTTRRSTIRKTVRGQWILRYVRIVEASHWSNFSHVVRARRVNCQHSLHFVASACSSTYRQKAVFVHLILNTSVFNDSKRGPYVPTIQNQVNQGSQSLPKHILFTFGIIACSSLRLSEHFFVAIVDSTVVLLQTNPKIHRNEIIQKCYFFFNIVFGIAQSPSSFA